MRMEISTPTRGYAMGDEKVLTKEIAEQFLLGEGTINQYQTIDSPETAKLLATAECDLKFEGLTRLNLDIAAELNQHTGGDLWLDGLLELPLDLAQVLSKHVGRITFDSVADLDVETATAIAQKKGALGFSVSLSRRPNEPFGRGGENQGNGSKGIRATIASFDE